ncbi:hypothetical protein PsorP6_001324 [Peronosclerospora sorghi]|uniref:Uncharacterized protein n=1 Tax=Peronosclerospora sorghi TaxID=230839 RepID=A0ACC0WU19_9STRA|nr:hypothetical protein PsorP6_001324 [Peronosclerospora sorghi]
MMAEDGKRDGNGHVDADSYLKKKDRSKYDLILLKSFSYLHFVSEALTLEVIVLLTERWKEQFRLQGTENRECKWSRKI